MNISNNDKTKTTTGTTRTSYNGSNKDKTKNINSSSSSSIAKSNAVENVLVLQGGGSLGAFGCGKHNVAMSKVITRHLNYIEELYVLIETMLIKYK
jgi:hypothetical protein